ncbi:MAG: tyrosine recombinase XerC [Clostridia bacterium]|nr:tyrosine recombinase XerC [Clostridia bacterium]
MAVNFANEAPDVIKEYLFYLQTIKGRSEKTVDEYYLDLRTFFRFLKIKRKMTDVPFEEILIDDIDIDIIKSVSLMDAYEFMNYLSRERSNSATSRARKCSALKQFFNYLTVKKHYLDVDPMRELEIPKNKKTLPKYLTLEQSIELLNAVDGNFKERDYCILTLFLNCGLRLAELVALNMSSIRSDNTMVVLGKGNKERIVYLNEACISALNDWRRVRPNDGLKDRDALFVSSHHKRLSRESVQKLVQKYLKKIGLDAQGYSCHKLRHTAATLMYQHGEVDIRVLKDVLGHENLGTTQIYTHISSAQLEAASNKNPLSRIKANK